MFRLKSAKTIDYYRHLHENIEYIAASTLISEASDHLLLQSVDIELQQSIYSLLEEAYNALNEEKDTKIIVSIYIAKLLQLFGTSMEVDSCVLCGNTKVSSFSVSDGGFLCLECAKKRKQPLLSPNILKAIRYINKAQLSQYDLVKQNIDSKDIPIDIFVSFYETHIGSILKSFFVL